MISVRPFFVLLVIASVASGAAVPFKVSDQNLPKPPVEEGKEKEGEEKEPSQRDKIALMKLKAVSNFLRKAMGNQFYSVSSEVTTEFADQYVMDYKLTRDPKDRNTRYLEGHLDSDGLKKWMRLATTGGKVRPFFLMSSTLPGMSVSPRETRSAATQKPLVKSVYDEFNAHLSRMGAGLSLISVGEFFLDVPPRSRTEIGSLSALGRNTYNNALWVHLSPCRRCGGARMETILYNLQKRRIAIVRSDNLKLGVSDYNSEERMKKVIQPPVEAFARQFRELVGRGTMQSSVHRLVVQKVDSYKGYKALDKALEDREFISKAVIRQVEPGIVEFDLWASMGSGELGRKLEMTTYPGFRLTPVAVDSGRIVMRYSR